MVEKAKKRERRKILVTGSGGMLGGALCRKLSSKYAVFGLDARRGGFSPTELCDITSRTATFEAIEHVSPDLVIHTAAWTDVDGCEADPGRAKKVNINGTENVAQAAAKASATLFYISTDFVFDGLKKTPYTEEDPPSPKSVYARSKLEGEKKVRMIENYMILRTSWLFGANGNNFVDSILGRVEEKKDLKVVDDQIGSPTYAEDLVLAIGKLLDITLRQTTNDKRRMTELYHISNCGQVSWFDYAKEILKTAGIKSAKLTPIKSSDLGRPARRPAFSALDNSKFEKFTGFKMRRWQDALREYLREKSAH